MGGASSKSDARAMKGSSKYVFKEESNEDEEDIPQEVEIVSSKGYLFFSDRLTRVQCGRRGG